MFKLAKAYSILAITMCCMVIPIYFYLGFYKEVLLAGMLIFLNYLTVAIVLPKIEEMEKRASKNKKAE